MCKHLTKTRNTSQTLLIICFTDWQCLIGQTLVFVQINLINTGKRQGNFASNKSTDVSDMNLNGKHILQTVILTNILKFIYLLSM
jgi:hypothetical protein